MSSPPEYLGDPFGVMGSSIMHLEAFGMAKDAIWSKRMNKSIRAGALELGMQMEEISRVKSGRSVP